MEELNRRLEGGEKTESKGGYSETESMREVKKHERWTSGREWVSGSEAAICHKQLENCTNYMKQMFSDIHNRK